MAAFSLLRFSPLLPLQTLPKPCFSTAGQIHLPLRSPARTVSTPSRRLVTFMSSRTTVPATERLISILAYSLPFFNALHYGRFLFARFPTLAVAVEPLLPMIGAYRSVPYAGFVAFFALYLGVVRNPNFGRYVRFNAMQAVVLDVLLALPTLLQRVFGVPMKGWGFKLMEIGYGALFVFAVGCYLYSFVCSVLGKTPHLPIVATAAERQM